MEWRLPLLGYCRIAIQAHNITPKPHFWISHCMVSCRAYLSLHFTSAHWRRRTARIGLRKSVAGADETRPTFASSPGRKTYRFTRNSPVLFPSCDIITIASAHRTGQVELAWVVTERDGLSARMLSPIPATNRAQCRATSLIKTVESTVRWTATFRGVYITWRISRSIWQHLLSDDWRGITVKIIRTVRAELWM